MKEDFSEVATSSDLSKRYEYSVAFINNLSEDKVLLAFTQNYILRVFESLNINIHTRDVMAEPKNLLKKVYQLAANQIYYDRGIFMSHMESYRELLQSRVTSYRIGVIHKAPGFTAEHLIALEAFYKKLDTNLKELQGGQNFNQTLLRILSDEDLKNILSQK